VRGKSGNGAETGNDNDAPSHGEPRDKLVNKSAENAFYVEPRRVLVDYLLGAPVERHSSSKSRRNIWEATEASKTLAPLIASASVLPSAVYRARSARDVLPRDEWLRSLQQVPCRSRSRNPASLVSLLADNFLLLLRATRKMQMQNRLSAVPTPPDDRSGARGGVARIAPLGRLHPTIRVWHSITSRGARRAVWRHFESDRSALDMSARVSLQPKSAGQQKIKMVFCPRNQIVVVYQNPTARSDLTGRGCVSDLCPENTGPRVTFVSMRPAPLRIASGSGGCGELAGLGPVPREELRQPRGWVICNAPQHISEPRTRIAAQRLLHLRCQAVHAAAHVRCPGR
jgi:hypothetical protein